MNKFLSANRRLSFSVPQIRGVSLIQFECHSEEHNPIPDEKYNLVRNRHVFAECFVMRINTGPIKCQRFLPVLGLFYSYVELAWPNLYSLRLRTHLN